MSATPSQVDPGSVPQAEGGAIGVPGRSPVLSRPRPTPKPRLELCPYCGRESVNTTRCATCGGQFDALSKQATQNAMGPWWLREGDRPLRPGCSYDTIRGMVGRGTITGQTVLRGPTTRQFWTRARRVPGVAHLLGVCHSCQREVGTNAFMCAACGASFVTEPDRQHLGLSPVALLPGQAAAERIAAVSAASMPVPMGVVPAASGPTPTNRPNVREGFGQPGGLGLPGVLASGEEKAVPRGGAASERVETVVRYVRRPRSTAGTLAIMVFGATMAVGGLWVALLAAQGSSAGALLALGIDPGVQPANRLARAGVPGTEPQIPDPEVGTAGTNAGAASGATDLSSHPGTDPEAQIASGSTGTALRAPAADLASLPESPTDTGTTSVLAILLGHVEAGGPARLGQATALVNQAERERRMTGDEASAWRMALEARAERAGMSGLP